MKEIEVKSTITDIDDFLDRAQKYGFVFADLVTQNDIIFLANGIKFSDIKPGVPVVRIRHQNNQITLTLKKRLLNELDKIEHEVIINNDQEASEIVKNMDFYEVLRVNKKRRVGKFNDLNICLDEVAGLGLFVEAEKLCETGDALEIQEELFCLLEKLGVKREHRVTKGYDTLIYNKLNNINL